MSLTAIIPNPFSGGQKNALRNKITEGGYYYPRYHLSLPSPRGNGLVGYGA